MERRRRILLPLCITLLVVAVILGLRAVPYSSLWRERTYSRLPLSALERDLARHPDDSLYHYYLGRRLLEAGRTELAYDILEKAVGLNPDDPRTRSAWADAAMSLGRVTGAFGQLSEFSRTHPDNAEGHRLLGQFYGGQNAMERARDELTIASQLDSSNAETWFLLAKAREQTLDVVGAREAVSRSLLLDPGNAAANLLQGRLLAARDSNAALAAFRNAVRLTNGGLESKRALAMFLLERGEAESGAEGELLATEILKTSPDDRELFRIRGKRYLDRGMLNDAVRDLQQAALAPADAEAARLFALALRRSARVSEAETWEKTALRRQQEAELYRKLFDGLVKSPKEPSLHRQMATLEAKRGRAEQVLKHYSIALQVPIDSPRALVPSANALRAEGYPNEALALARLAVRHGSNNPEASESRGLALLALGRFREASVDLALAADLLPERQAQYRATLQEAIRERSKNPSPARQLFLQAQELRRSEIGPRRTSEEIFALLERAIALEPENTEILRWRFELLVATKQKEKAFRAGEALLQISPEDTVCHVKMAALLAETDRPQIDEEQIEEHLAVARPDPLLQPTIHFVQGVVAMRTGRFTEAVKELRQAIQMDPSSDIAYLRLSQAERSAGNRAASEAAAGEFQRRRAAKQQEADLLAAITANPGETAPFLRAIEFYKKSGRTLEADAVRREMDRVASAKIAPKGAKGK